MSLASIIGTRDPDPQQRQAVEHLALWLTRNGHKVRTGGAYGIDEAAMTGALKPMLEVFLPWASYNSNIIPKDTGRIVVADPKVHHRWFASVDEYHPAPERLSRGARALHARNYPLAAEPDIVCAFPNEKGGGGTGQGIRIALAECVPVIQICKGQPFKFEELLHKVQRLLEDIQPRC